MDWTGLRAKAATLVNFSSTGALIHTDQLPTLNEPLEVLLVDAPKIGWLGAVPVRFGSTNEVGIRFTRPFPMDFLSTLVREGDSPWDADTDDARQDFGEDIKAFWELPEEN